MIETSPDLNKVESSLLKRKLVHIDMDCFYAAVEARDNPSLKGLPLVVGGDPSSRGVVATCSYEARKFGIKSAMACSLAKKLCPEAVFIRPNFSKYKNVSSEIRSIFHRYTDKVEPLSLDEAYIDVTGHQFYATRIASMIRSDIAKELGLTASAGVGPNKLIAKIASDLNKPNGLTVVRPHEVAAFMAPLRLRKISGVGPVTERKLASLGLHYCQDILACQEGFLTTKLGLRFAHWLIQRCKGIDNRAVETTRVRKSLSCEDTFSQDIINKDQVFFELSRIASKVSSSLQKQGLVGKTISLKVKYFDFQQITRSKTIEHPSDCPELIARVCMELSAKTQVGKKPIRLLGVCMGGIERFQQSRGLMF